MTQINSRQGNNSGNPVAGQTGKGFLPGHLPWLACCSAATVHIRDIPHFTSTPKQPSPWISCILCSSTHIDTHPLSFASRLLYLSPQRRFTQNQTLASSYPNPSDPSSAFQEFCRQRNAPYNHCSVSSFWYIQQPQPLLELIRSLPFTSLTASILKIVHRSWILPDPSVSLGANLTLYTRLAILYWLSKAAYTN